VYRLLLVALDGAESTDKLDTVNLAILITQRDEEVEKSADDVFRILLVSAELKVFSQIGHHISQGVEV